jgi:NodT family efflux transporter outer membrane factor (OMF) lipoprotein
LAGGLKEGNALRPIALALVAAAAWSLTGCKAGPDYVKPPAMAAPPESYKEAAGWKVASPQDQIARGAWWKVFCVPALDSLEQQVELSNQNLKATEAQYRQALAAIRVASASLYPTITAGAGITAAHRLAPSGAGTTAGPAITGRNTTLYSLPLDLSWEIDVWGRIRRAIEAAEYGAQASESDLESARLSAQATLAQSFFQLQSLDAQRSLLEATIADLERALAVTQNRYAVGVVGRTDVLQAETQLESTRAQALDVANQRASTEHAIAVLIGKPASGFSLPSMPLTAVPPEIPLLLPSELLERRPDVAAAERRAAAANAEIGVATAAWFPQISLSASTGFIAPSLAGLFSLPSLYWALGPRLSETVFEGLGRSAAIDQARAAYEVAVANYRQTALGAFQEVEDNLAALRILEQEQQAQDKAVEAARQVVTITTNQYEVGTVSYLEVLVAQTTALENERAAIELRGRRMSASVLLIKALGGGWMQGQK